MKHLLIITLLLLTTACGGGNSAPVSNDLDLPFMYPEIDYALLVEPVDRNIRAVAQVAVYDENDQPLEHVIVQAKFVITAVGIDPAHPVATELLESVTDENGIATFSHVYVRRIGMKALFKVINVLDPLGEYMYVDTVNDTALLTEGELHYGE
jgi:hypothetical protein